MPFEPGHKKLGGRKAGSPDRKRPFREAFEDGLEKPIPARLIEIIKADPSKESEILLAVMPYCYAKFAPVEGPREVSPEEQALAEREDSEFLKNVENDPDPGP